MENTLIPNLEDQSAEYISQWVKWALDGDYKSRPFYYLTYVDAQAEGNEKPIKKVCYVLSYTHS
jgi:hypothetical protein